MFLDSFEDERFLSWGGCDDPASRLMSYHSVSPIFAFLFFVIHVLWYWIGRIEFGMILVRFETLSLF